MRDKDKKLGTSQHRLQYSSEDGGLNDGGRSGKWGRNDRIWIVISVMHQDS